MGTLELAAVRVEPSDSDLEDALSRVEDLEGQPMDEATWKSMIDLARTSVGGSPDEVKEDRRWGSVKASFGATLVDVLLHGNLANIYFDVGHQPEDQFYAVLARLRDAGLTVVQISDFSEVTPSDTVAELLAAQDADQGL